ANRTAGRRRAVDGHLLVGVDHVQGQPLAVRAVVMVGVRVVVEAELGVTPGAAKVRTGQGLGQSRPGQHRQRISQQQPHFQVRGRAGQQFELVHNAPPAGTAAASGSTSRNSGLSRDNGSATGTGRGRRTARAVRYTMGSTPAMNSTSPGSRSHSMRVWERKN